MIKKVVGIGAIAAVAAGIVVYKSVSRSYPPPPQAATVAPRVLLFADLGEEDEGCGCGQIIRMFKAASAKGAPVRQVDPERDKPTAAQYGVTVGPTVIVLDSNGAVAERLVGESDETIKAIGVALASVDPHR